jgi:hypothetical protein
MVYGVLRAAHRHRRVLQLNSRSVRPLGRSGPRMGDYAEFDVFVTADQSLEYQQSVARLKMGVVVLAAGTNRLESDLPLLAGIAAAIERVAPGMVVRITA